MTVRELIEKLELLDPEADVVVRLLGRARGDRDHRRWSPPFIDVEGAKKRVYLA